MSITYIEVEYLQLEQPIGPFYIGKINWSDLIKIANADIRTIEVEDGKSDSFDSYLGIQRRISPSRITEISQYVTTVDSTFPTGIILHIESQTKLLDGKKLKYHDIEFIENNLERIETIDNFLVDKASKKLKIRNNEQVARILDGQHRLEGLRKGFENKNSIPIYELNVTIFVDLDIDDQAQIFSVINKAQTKVNKSLVYDLYEYAKTRSPQKTSHDIVRLLNRMPESPFYKSIKILGTAENKETEKIAQATFVELIQTYISQNPMKDRDDLKRKTLFGGNNKLTPLENIADKKKWIFRNLFIKEKDEIIMNTLWNYFKNVQDKWPKSWNENTEGNILNKSTGLIALMKFLRPVIVSLDDYDRVITYEEFKSIFDRINLADETFTKDIYIPGSSGQSLLLKALKADSSLI